MGVVSRATSFLSQCVFNTALWFRSSTNYLGKLIHANAADRTWTFPDKDGTVAMTSDIPAVITDHGGLSGLGDNDHPHYLQKAGDNLTGDLTADAGVLVDGVDVGGHDHSGGAGMGSQIPSTSVTGLGTLATQSGTFSGTSSNTNTGDQTITLTGDVTGSGTGTFAATVAADAVTYAKMQNVSATDKLLGRSTAGAGDVEEIACTAAGRAILDDADAAAQRTTLGAMADAQPACRVYNSANISINDSTTTALTYNSELSDPTGMHSTSSNTHRITIATAGVYLFVSHTRFAANTTGSRAAVMRHQGTTEVARDVRSASTSGFDNSVSLTALYPMAASEWMDIAVYQNSGGALNVEASGASPSFSAVRVSS